MFSATGIASILYLIDRYEFKAAQIYPQQVTNTVWAAWYCSHFDFYWSNARRISHAQAQRRLFSAVYTPTADARHGADGKVLTDRNGGFRGMQLKKVNGIPTVDSRSLRDIRKHVEWWDENYIVNVAVVKGDGDHFCSGLRLDDLRGDSDHEVRDRLDALCRVVTTMGASETPLLSVINGLCVGSGYALAMGKYRFATEDSVFCIPEATLGLGLSGGLSYTLPRLLGGNSALALCLALSGMALEGPDLFFSQLATSYMTHRRLDTLMYRLSEVNQDPKPFGDATPTFEGAPSAVETVLERSVELSWNVDGIEPYTLGASDGRIPTTPFVHELLPQVEEAFTAQSVEEVVSNLSERSEPWARTALRNIERSSPLSLKVIFEQVNRGGSIELSQCLDEEFSVNCHLFQKPDFEVAMQARDSGGSKPAWKSGTLEQVTRDQVSAIFQSVPRPEERKH